VGLLLAMVGVSLTGAAPVPPKGRNIIDTEAVMETEKDEPIEEEALF
jgi:hypothetical protein